MISEGNLPALRGIKEGFIGGIILKLDMENEWRQSVGHLHREVAVFPKGENSREKAYGKFRAEKFNMENHIGPCNKYQEIVFFKFLLKYS